VLDKVEKWFMAFARVLAPLGGDYLLPMRARSPETHPRRLTSSVALLLEEGLDVGASGFNPRQSVTVAGRRRPRGHLVAPRGLQRTGNDQRHADGDKP
jgi:hypothetical protein